MVSGNTIFTEFENENRMRSYPFAEHATLVDVKGKIKLPDDIFVDAMIYPLNPIGTIYISSIDNTTGVLSISDNTGIIAVGNILTDSEEINLYSTSPIRRHAGVIIYNKQYLNGLIFGMLPNAKFNASGLPLAASTVCPIVNNDVLSIVLDGNYMYGDIKFNNPNTTGINVVTHNNGDGTSTIRFDAIPTYGDVEIFSIKKIYCITAGTTPFNISKYPYENNTMLLTLSEGRDTICNGVHQETSYMVRDVCEDPIEPGSYNPRPENNNELIFPVEHNCFNIVTDDIILGYENPISITFDDTILPSPIISNFDASDNLVDSQDVLDTISLQSRGTKGLKIEIPGLNGGL
jgi:hypothetical protein